MNARLILIYLCFYATRDGGGDWQNLVYKLSATHIIEDRGILSHISNNYEFSILDCFELLFRVVFFYVFMGKQNLISKKNIVASTLKSWKYLFNNFLLKIGHPWSFEFQCKYQILLSILRPPEQVSVGYYCGATPEQANKKSINTKLEHTAQILIWSDVILLTYFYYWSIYKMNYIASF